MNLSFELSQKQVLSQHMVQSVEILQMSVQELEHYIETLAVENPVIELHDSAGDRISEGTEEVTWQDSISTELHREVMHRTDLQRKLEWLEATDMQNSVYYQQERDEQQGQEQWRDSEGEQEDLKEYLLSQLIFQKYAPSERTIVEFMVQSLDSRGYFTEDISFVAEYFSVPKKEIEKRLQEIQILDPAGVGARNLQECLLLQLRRKMSGIKEGVQTEKSLPERLVLYHMEDIAKNHLKDIAKKQKATIEEVVSACEVIRSLNPKPGNSFSSREQLRYISPDALVVKLEDKFEILVNDYQYPGFSISNYYQELCKSTKDKEAKEYLQKKIQQAEWVSNCIHQRSSTLMRVMKVLVERQKPFFEHGAGHKQPLRLADIATELALHESTISRAMRGKYLQCAWGVFPLNYFLSAVATVNKGVGEEQTAEQIKKCIQEMIESEDKQKPYSDQTISEKLKLQGIEVSRRTVNKYRQEMNLPDKSGRKVWK